MEFAPLYLREISVAPSSDSDRKSMAKQGLRKRGKLGARPNIVWYKEQKLQIVRTKVRILRTRVPTSVPKPQILQV